MIKPSKIACRHFLTWLESHWLLVDSVIFGGWWHSHAGFSQNVACHSTKKKIRTLWVLCICLKLVCSHMFPTQKKKDMWTGLPSTIIHTYRIYQPCYPIRSNQIKPRFLDPRFLTLRAAASFLSGPTRQEKQSLAEGRGAWRISGWWFSPTLLKNMSSSIGIMTFPTEWKNNPNVPKPPTRYIGNIMEIYLENNGNIMRISI